MDKLKKRLLIFIIFVSIIFIFRIASNPELKIRNFVKENEEELVEISEQYLNGERYATSEREYFHGVEINGLKKGEIPIIEFFYSGKGLVPSSVYYGFYYSPEDKPAAHQNYKVPMVPEGENKWSWSGEGDNGGVTKKIKDNWYYYEAWY